jgi:hypothetical protein
MSQTTTVKPIKTFDLHLNWIPDRFDDWHLQDPREMPPSHIDRPDNPILVIYQTNEGTGFRQPCDVSYYLTLDEAPRSSLQSFPSASTIAIHGPIDNEAPNRGHENCLERVKIHQPSFTADDSCPMCIINTAAFPQTIPPPPRAFSSGPHTELHTSLGHGEWYDYKLTQLLDTAFTNEKRQAHKDHPLKWVAGTEEWDPLYWEGRGKIIGGHLKLSMHGNEEVLAIYKVRGATWLRRFYHQGMSGLWEHWEDGGGASRGSLGILKQEGLAEEVVRHMLMACIGIEEQIMRNKGFDGAYHGGWL